MRRNLPYALGAIAIALVVGGYRIHTMPKRLMRERTAIYLEQASGYNNFVHQKRADASWREFVSPSPDLLYSYLVFDTTGAALAVEIPEYGDYWVNQMVDDQTDTFGYAGHGSGASRFVVYSEATPAFATPEGFTPFKSPSPTGLLLLRYLVRTPDSIARIDDIRRKIRVRKLTPDSKIR
jgi:hypothetical protein